MIGLFRRYRESGFDLCCVWFDLQEDPDTIDRLIVDAEASYNKWRHPDPYIGKQIKRTH